LEVVFAEEGGGCALQDFEVDAPGIGVDITSQERWANLLAGRFDGESAIFVCLGYGRVSRVKSFGNDARVENANGRGEGPIKGADKVGGWNSRMQLEACNLGEGVHAGVGAPGPLGEGGLAQDAIERRSQFALDGGVAGLNLPAVKVGAIVGEDEFPVLHWFGHGSGDLCHEYLCC